MEEKQEKKEEFKGKMGIVWLTGILVIILGCVTVYTFKLVNENKKLKQAPAQVQQTQTATVQEQPKVQSESEEKNTEKIEEKIMTADEKFYAYVSNMKKEMNDKIVYTMEGEKKSSAINEKVSFKEYENDGSLTEVQNHDISLNSTGKLAIDQKTIAENVLNFKVLQIGSNGLHYIIFINDKGTVGYMRISKLKTMANDSLHEIKNIKNIIGLLGTIDTYEIGLIDIEGNIIKVSIQ